MNNGSGLENFVYELYKDLGYNDVIKDYRIKKSNGDESARGQIDLTYRQFMIRRYVECKQRSNNNVNFDDYSKFETTLKLFKIPTYLGEMVTNSYFDDKVKLRAKETKIKLIDRDELVKLNESRKRGWKAAILTYRIMEIADTKGIRDALKYFYVRNLTLDKQLEYYTK